MEASSKRNTPRLPVEITYTAYNFEHCKHSIIEYTKDLIIQNRVKGIDISRRAVNVAFEANVKDLYVKGSAMRQELLQQVSNRYQLFRAHHLFLKRYDFLALH